MIYETSVFHDEGKEIPEFVFNNVSLEDLIQFVSNQEIDHFIIRNRCTPNYCPYNLWNFDLLFNSTKQMRQSWADGVRFGDWFNGQSGYL
jgi:hypothetical protein